MLDKTTAQQVVNNFYAVFLGFVLSSFFIIENTDGQPYHVRFFEGIEWIILSMLVFYYIIDWFTTIFLLKNDKEITYNHLFLLLCSNITLCYTILLSINGGFQQFIVFGVYSLVVPLWDVMVAADGLKKLTYKNQQKEANKIKYRYIFGLRFLFGAVLCIPLGLLLWKGSSGTSDELLTFVHLMLSLIVIVKWLRMIVIFRIYV